MYTDSIARKIKGRTALMLDMLKKFTPMSQ